MTETTKAAYRIVTERLVIRCWEPADAVLAKEAIDSSLEHLRPWMPWAHAEPTTLEQKVQLLRLVPGQVRPRPGCGLRHLRPRRAPRGRRHGPAPAGRRPGERDRLLDPGRLDRAGACDRVDRGADPGRVRDRGLRPDRDPLRPRERPQRRHPQPARLRPRGDAARRACATSTTGRATRWCSRCSPRTTRPRPVPPPPARQAVSTRPAPSCLLNIECLAPVIHRRPR